MTCKIRFMRSETRCAVFVGCVLGLSACVADESLSSNSQSVTTLNRLASNRLASNRLASNRLASNQLALNDNGGAELMSTDDGRNVLSYIVGCAIDAGDSIIAFHRPAGGCSADADCGTLTTGSCQPNGSCKYTFPGNLDLAPQWVDHNLDEAGQGWISACMFARVNAHDTAEEISLHGEHPALTVGIDEGLLYRIEEGAFYGNMFLSSDRHLELRDFAHVCRGEGQASGEFGGLVDRDCAEPDPSNPAISQCGFSYEGDCADYTPLYPSAFACDERESGDPCEDSHGSHGDDDRDGHHRHRHECSPTADHGFYYEGCHVAAGPRRSWGHRGFQQVITTFVTP
ncbi:MAG: hypothetical protein JWO36_1854 [Myxococcales bacterium]|nr:hypothetical protein [Myxococcales bacterium]